MKTSIRLEKSMWLAISAVPLAVSSILLSTLGCDTNKRSVDTGNPGAAPASPGEADQVRINVDNPGAAMGDRRRQPAGDEKLGQNVQMPTESENPDATQ
jgi:hypothetical protein